MQYIPALRFHKSRFQISLCQKACLGGISILESRKTFKSPQIEALHLQKTPEPNFCSKNINLQSSFRLYMQQKTSRLSPLGDPEYILGSEVLRNDVRLQLIISHDIPHDTTIFVGKCPNFHVLDWTPIIVILLVAFPMTPRGDIPMIVDGSIGSSIAHFPMRSQYIATTLIEPL